MKDQIYYTNILTKKKNVKVKQKDVRIACYLQLINKIRSTPMDKSLKINQSINVGQ
jgi:hypothetical protein